MDNYLDLKAKAVVQLLSQKIKGSILDHVYSVGIFMGVKSKARMFKTVPLMNLDLWNMQQDSQFLKLPSIDFFFPI